MVFLSDYAAEVLKGGEGMEDFERDYNGDRVRKCAECEWCKPLEGSDGEIYYFCMDTDGGAFLEQTGLCGWCTAEAGDEEEETGALP